ncbi:MAG: EVE domain-containing protein [Pseudomonadota bacterium]|nr:EVE domain-containing protein [Pseudomonadota bacterium]
MSYWLMKSEPDVYSIDHLIAEPRKTDHWDGIRNYQARNFMRDKMKKGDLSFFYHSNCPEPAVVGIMEIVCEAYPDHTQFDSNEKYFDAGSDAANPRWLMVDVRFRRKFKRPVTLQELKSKKRLGNMRLVQRGNRLSILPVTATEWRYILQMAGET